MARIKCDCGNILSNSSHPEIEYKILSDDQWNELGERTESGENFVDIRRSVVKYTLWKCSSCGRLYIFEDFNDYPLQVYNLEKDNNGKW